ncbi:MAG: hypothetical protein LBQ66_01985 [Planctomycetaceae bacterium]|nr:hypothetical protein [Planctomycetaceae bacterium]
MPVRVGDPVVGLRRRNRLAVGYPPYVGDACSDPILAFALSGRELLGAIFHRALPCAMGLLPRWGVLVLPVRFGDPVVGLRRRNRPAVGYPPYDHQRKKTYVV